MDEKNQVQAEFITTPEDIDGEDVDGFYSVIKNVIRNLRERIPTDSRLQEILTDQSDVLKSKDSVEHSDPEPLTIEEVIRPLFDFLGLTDLGPEAGSLSDVRAEQADFATRIDGKRLLIEAEPLNKNLKKTGHGINQVREWLRYDDMESEFGIATNGFRWIFIKRDRETYSYEIIADISIRAVFLEAFEDITGLSSSLDRFSDPAEEPPRNIDMIKKFLQFFKYEGLRDIIFEADDVIRKKKKEITDEFYEDYIKYVFGILDEDTGERTRRCLVKDGVIPPKGSDNERQKRLFSVLLMNRLVFIKFLEEIGIVQEGLLKELKDRHKDGKELTSFYDTYISKLIYEVLNEKPEDRKERVKRIGCYDEIKYLNGGLFRPQLEETDEKKYSVTDSVLYSIIDFLEEYNFSTDGESDALDPSILGNVFEKTINYIAGKEGKQKDLGAFYTPDPITKFAAEETTKNTILERLASRLVERGWPEPEVTYESVEELIRNLPPKVDLIKDLNDEIDDIKVVDPACGSGHFLISVMSEIVNARKMLYDKLEDERPRLMDIKKRTVVNNIFGVDIVAPAVEITKLRLWLSIISEVKKFDIDEIEDDELALPNVAFNVKQGNSLLGLASAGPKEGDTKIAQWNLLEKMPDYIEKIKEAKEEHDDLETLQEDINELKERMSTNIMSEFKGIFGGIDIEDTFPVDETSDPLDVAEKACSTLKDGHKVSKLGFYVKKPESPLDDFPEYKDDLESKGDIKPYKWKANMKLDGRVNDSDISTLLDALENHPDQGSIKCIFAERKLSESDAENLSAFQWIIEFPECWDLENKDDSEYGFDVVIGNPPFGADIEGIEKEVLEQEGLYECESTERSAELFMERAFELSLPDGLVGFVMPKTLSYYTNWSEIRNKILDESVPISLFDNGLAFEDVNFETITNILSLDVDAEAKEVEIYLSENLRSAKENKPVHSGSIPFDVMKSTDRLLLRAMNDVDRSMRKRFEENTVPLSELWSEPPYRGLYIPAKDKETLSKGDTLFIESVPSVDDMFLHEEGVWNIALDELSKSRQKKAKKTQQPRLLFKVLRGSKLRVYKDSKGRFASTEKLVNVPVSKNGHEHDLNTLCAVLNSTVVSYYLQKFVYSETTETARVMDEPYIKDIPIPCISERKSTILSNVTEACMFLQQCAQDSVVDDELEEVRELFRDIIEVLVFDLYFDDSDFENAWDELEKMIGVFSNQCEGFEEWIDKRFEHRADHPFDATEEMKDCLHECLGDIDEAELAKGVDELQDDERFLRMREILS